jgi:hypothetical protein
MTESLPELENIHVREQSYMLSGFGGGYEDTCQRMLWRGVRWLKEKQPPVEIWAGASSYENVYGVLITEGDDLKALEEYMLRDTDCTGAMHQCVMGHICFIHKNGIEKWREELGPVRQKPGDSFIWEGDMFPKAEVGS